MALFWAPEHIKYAFMIKNYLRVALRTLARNKTFSFINIIGLAIGTLCCLYIVLYVQDQYRYDKHHNQAKDIYRVTTVIKSRGDETHMATTSPPVAPAMKQDFPEVMQYTRVIPTLGIDQHQLSYKNKSFYEKDAKLVDATFFEIFSYHFVYGNPATALMQPSSIVLLSAISDKLFADEDPMGKTIEINNDWGKKEYTVTGVVDNSLGKTQIQANFFIPLNGYPDIAQDPEWGGHNFANSYVKLQPGADPITLEKKLQAFLNKYGGKDLKNRGMGKQLHLQPVGSVHTSPGYSAESGKTASPSFLYLLLLIAGLIQVIACINFMNLSTARASNRAKEVGIRKVIGAGRKSLVFQFLGESFLLSLLSVLIAILLLIIALPFLNQITQADVRISFIEDGRLWALAAVIVFFTGLLAGSYPAFYLSAFQAIKVMKGNFTNHISSTGIRRSLVVFQFVLSVVFISAITVIYAQLDYIKNKDLGFDRNQKLIFNFYTNDTKSKIPAFMSELRQLSEVSNVSMANGYPDQAYYHNWGVFLNGGNLATATPQNNLTTDENFVKTMGIQMKAGRDFQLHDSNKVLINETLAKRLGLKTDKAPGTKLYTEDPSQILEIAGVMKDFNFNSLHQDISPFMLQYNPRAEDMATVIINTSSRNYKSSLGKIEKIWKEFLPATPFDYKFLDEEVQKQYNSEIVLSNIIYTFTWVAVLISCLGLLGLSAFSAEQKNKEIGIRKVLGAGTPGIIWLLSRNFLKPVLAAIVIAMPVSWWVMNKWLSDFSYRVAISWWMLTLGGVVAIFIALITVSSQAMKAAVANPIKSLKAE